MAACAIIRCNIALQPGACRYPQFCILPGWLLSRHFWCLTDHLLTPRLAQHHDMGLHSVEWWWEPGSSGSSAALLLYWCRCTDHVPCAAPCCAACILAITLLRTIVVPMRPHMVHADQCRFVPISVQSSKHSLQSTKVCLCARRM